MLKNEMDKIRFCAFCPNVCRIYYPSSKIQIESTTPSHLSYLCYAVFYGYLSFTKEVKQTLNDTTATEKCQEACPYGFKISECLKKVVLALETQQ